MTGSTTTGSTTTESITTESTTKESTKGSAANPEYDAIIIGSGFSGLYGLHHLRDELGLKVRVFDGAGGVGGTWWYNRYPGARVDAPSSPFYAYTFSKELVDEWEWTETQTSQASVLAYLEHFAERFDLIKDIQFETWVTDACYDEQAQSWTITTDSGQQASAQFLICATGALFIANKPDYPGIDDFAGECYHTGRWPHEPVDFSGKRVAVIGTGSSGIQAIPEIAKQGSTRHRVSAYPAVLPAGAQSPAGERRAGQMPGRLGRAARFDVSPRRMAVQNHTTAGVGLHAPGAP